MRTKRRQNLAAFLLLTMSFVGRLWGQTNEPPARVAIIYEAAEFSGVADLLTVELSAKPYLQVLEREQIAKVYREQGLSAANRDYVKLGQVLGSDGLLLMEMVADGTNNFVSVRLVAVKPGVVIGNVRTPWPLPDAPGWARWLANHLTPLLPKLSVSAKDAIPISVVNLRSAVNSAEARELERQLTVLTIERLTRERELFVLERRRMDLLSTEQELQGMGESAFWNGSYLLDGILDRDGYTKDTVTISARLVPSKGSTPQLLEASGSRANPAEAAARLAKALMEALKLGASVQPWSPPDEAENYFSEGTWAYRWKMLPEAQTASESAWALGKRTKEVAALRLRAYGDAILPKSISGSIEIPAVPEVTRLQTAIRALSLFCQDQHLAGTATNFLDQEWVELGLEKALRPATAVLDGYYHAAELRQGNEEQLAELRSLARQVAAVLETNMPPSRTLDYGRRVSSPRGKDQAMFNRWRESNRFWEMRDALWNYQWEHGGIWHERPEDALPMFHCALEAGHRPDSLPRVVGWNWVERKRVPGVLKQFVQQVCASTNPSVRREGLYLAVVRAPFDAERQDQRCVEELIAAMWADRDQIWSSKDAASLFRRTEQALEHKYYVWSSPIGVEPFAGFKQRFRLEYLRSAAAWNEDVFRALFPIFSTYCSRAEARELMPMLEAFAQRLNPAKSGEPRQTLQKLSNESGIAINANLASDTKTNRPMWPAEKPLVVKFIPWRLDGSQPREGLKSMLVEALVHEGKLWGSVQHCQPDGWINTPRGLSFVTVDQNTGSSEEIPFPNKVGWADGRFAVSADTLFTTVGERLHRYQFRNRTWEPVPVPIPADGRLLAVSNLLYVTTSDSLLELSPESSQVQVLVGSRRSPPVNELDSLWKPGAFVYPAPANTLGVRLGHELYAFSRANRAWERVASLQFLKGKVMYKGSWVREFVSDDGIFLLRAMMATQLFAHWGGEKELEPLLESHSDDPWSRRNPLPTRWKWPDGLSLLDACALAHGRDLWILCPRKAGAIHNEEQVRFNDERMATLLHFEPEFREALSVPIQFEQNGKLMDPFEGFHQGLFAPGEKSPYWLETTSGFIFTVPASPGHWLVSKEALQPRFQALRKKSRESVPPKSPSTTAATGHPGTNAEPIQSGPTGPRTLKP